MTTIRKNPFRIRRAGKADLDDLLRLENASFTTDLLSRERMRYWINAANGILVVAEALPAARAKHGTGVLGYCLAFTRRNTTIARAYSLAIAASARGQGLGGRLLQATERASKQMGCTAIKLEVAQSNTVAIALYEKLGYRRIAALPGYYEDGQDGWRMQKTL